MKKVFLYLLMLCSTMVYGVNTVPGNVINQDKQRGKVHLNAEKDKSLLTMSSDDFFNRSIRKVLDRQTEKRNGIIRLIQSDFLQSYLRETEEKAVKRLDSCIAKDINGKIFAKDYYYYYPYGTYPAGALKANEIWSLDEETNEWYGFRMSATYDEFGNANNRLVELNEHGTWSPSVRYTALYTSREGDLLLDQVDIWENGEWTGDSKRTTSYDNQGRRTLMNVFVWESDSKAWVNAEKAEYVYETGKSTELGYTWMNNTWVPITKMETITDQNGNTTKVENCQWNNETNDWLVDMRIENTYDENGNLTLTVNYNYVEEFGELLPYGKEIHTYKNDVIEIEYYGYNFDTKEWDGFSKTMEKYVDDLVVENYFYSWASDTKSWMNDTKGVHEYNSDGKPTMTINYAWDGSKWQNNTKVEIEYNEYGYEIHNVGYMYDMAVNAWIKNSELFEETDPEGRMLKLEGYLLDEEGNWVGSGMKEVFEYDENGKSVRDEFSIWNPGTGEWVIDEIADYYYTLITSQILTAKENATQIGVSSLDGKIHITHAQNEGIVIYTANGLLVFHGVATGNNEMIPADQGFYIVRVGAHSFKVNVRN